MLAPVIGVPAIDTSDAMLYVVSRPQQYCTIAFFRWLLQVLNIDKALSPLHFTSVTVPELLVHVALFASVPSPYSFIPIGREGVAEVIDTEHDNMKVLVPAVPMVAGAVRPSIVYVAALHRAVAEEPAAVVVAAAAVVVSELPPAVVVAAMVVVALPPPDAAVVVGAAVVVLPAIVVVAAIVVVLAAIVVVLAGAMVVVAEELPDEFDDS